MEALTAVNVAALTIYDMCKGVDKEIVIGESFLIKKVSGKSGLFRNKERVTGYFLKDTVINKEFILNNSSIIGIFKDVFESGDILKSENCNVRIVVYQEGVKLISKRKLEIAEGEKVWIE